MKYIIIILEDFESASGPACFSVSLELFRLIFLTLKVVLNLYRAPKNTFLELDYVNFQILFTLLVIGLFNR